MASVSATDLNTTDVVSVDNNVDLIYDEINEIDLECSDVECEISQEGCWTDLNVANENDDKLAVCEDEILGASVSYFSALQYVVSTAKAGSTIYIDGNYYPNTYNNNNYYQIIVDKPLNFVGRNGATFVMTKDKFGWSSNAGIFRVYSDGVTFKDITFKDGYIYDYFYSDYRRCGGAIYTSGSITIDNCKFLNNGATNTGGAIYIGGSGSCVISNSYFEGNKANNANGGAIDIQNSASCVISNCVFKSNSANYGGAIQVASTAKCSVSGSTFTSNSAQYGGAIFTTDSGAKVPEIVNSKFESNYASVAGGACYIQSVSSNNVRGCSFTNNHAAKTGGAIDYYKSNNIGVFNCNFTNCYVDNQPGGAIAIYSGSNILLDECVFTGCSAVNGGGAIYWESGGNLRSNNCTFVNCNSKDGLDAVSFNSATSGYEIADCNFDKPLANVVYQYTTLMDVNDLNIVLGDDGILRVNLSDSRGGQLADKQIIFTINNKNYTANTNSKGIATFNVKSYLTTLGSYNVSVIFVGSGFNRHVSKMALVNINRYEGTLSLSESGKYYGSKSVKIKLNNSRTGEGISESIHVEFSNGKTFDVPTDINGVATLPVTFEPGNYSLKAYVNSPNVNVNTPILDISIYKISGVISLSKSNNNKTLNIRVYNPDNGDNYSDIVVNLKFDYNALLDTVTTDSKGLASYPMQFAIGTYSVTASVDSSGYKEFPNAELDNIVISTVGKENSNIGFSSNNIVFDYLKSGYVTVNKMEGCTGVEAEVINHPEAKVVVDGNKITVSKLDAGNYKLRVTSVPDVYHDEVTREVGITVNKVDSSLTINPATCNYGDSATITASMNGCGISYSGVSVEGQKPIISVINNVITVSGLPAGTHTLKVTTIPDENHKSVTKTTTITVKPVNSKIGFNTPISFVYGTVGSIPLTLDGCSIVRESCTIVDHNEAVIDVNNNVVKVSNLSAGSYTLRISSKPDSNHNAVTQDMVITVTRADSNVDLKSKPLTFNYGETGQSNLILDGCSVLSDDVIVEGNSNAITWVVNNVVYVSNLAAGSYALKIKTTPDGNHKSVTKTFSVTVNKPLSTVEFIGSADFDYLGVGKTTLKLTGCTVNLDDIEVVGYNDAGVTLGKGNVVSISELDSGSYTLKVKTTPDANHRANTATLAFTVNKIDSKISFTKDVISFKYAESGSTPVVLENCRVANMSVVGHDDVQPVLEDDMISVSGLPVGNYRLKVTTDPDDNYNSVDAYINVAVTKNTANINVKKSQTVAYKKSTNWAITLKDSNGNPVSGIKVNLKIYKGNKLYKNVDNLKVTDANGITNYNTKGLPVGTYKFVVSVSHAGYNVKSVSTPVKVIKQTAVKIILNTKSDKKGAVISIIVKDKAGKKYLNNIKINLYIKTGNAYGKPITLITGNYKNGKGVSAYSTNMLTVGSHNVKVETADIKYSGSASKNVKVLASAKKYRNWWEKISKGKKTSYGT